MSDQQETQIVLDLSGVKAHHERRAPEYIPGPTWMIRMVPPISSIRFSHPFDQPHTTSDWRYVGLHVLTEWLPAFIKEAEKNGAVVLSVVETNTGDTHAEFWAAIRRREGRV